MTEPEIKICGITRPEEITILNQEKVDYAGFVFFEKSKRNISLSQAKELINALSPDIKKVAVTVSPDLSLITEIEEAGFDILQVHGEMEDELAERDGIPIWRAFNITGQFNGEMEQQLLQLGRKKQIQGVVFDGMEYGGGKTFDWKESEKGRQIRELLSGKKLILAGGLHAGNVRKGMELFEPDVVDISSGVEYEIKDGVFAGKDPEKIKAFVRKVRKDEE